MEPRARPAGRSRAAPRRGERDLRAPRGEAVARAHGAVRREGSGGSRMTCASCGADNREGRKFCAECGSPLAQGCPACGAANEPGEKFCGECGTRLTAGDGTPVVNAQPTPAAERRLVSILFADLVGFTAASENRDAEE